MFVRVVRFADVDPDRIRRVLERVQQNGGPPPGVPMKRTQFLFDEQQRTAVALQYFDTEEDLATAAAVLGAMEPGETPGTRVSVDTCELRLELEA